jgi:hypothetical protein
MWLVVVRSHAIFSFLVSGGFCLEKFLCSMYRCALYFVFFQIVLDAVIFRQEHQSNVHFWLLIDYVLDDLAVLAGYFYLYQFHMHLSTAKKKND